MAKALHTDDSITTCDCCGKSGLKYTVCMQLDDGSVAHYGCVCAGRNTGKTAKQITGEIESAQAAKIDAARKEYRNTPEYFAECARIAQRPRDMVGRAAADFVREAAEAARMVRVAIAARHGVESYKLS